MLMPSASVSVANTARMRRRGEELLDDLAEQRQHPGVVGGEPAREPLDEVEVAEHRRGPRRRATRRAPRRTAGSAAPSRSVISRVPAASSWPTAASHPTRLKMKVIAGSSPSRSSSSMTSARLAPPPGRPPRAKPRPPAPPPGPAARRRGPRRAGRPRWAGAAPTAAPRLVLPAAPLLRVRIAVEQVGVDPVAGEQVEHRRADEHVLGQRHRAVLGDDDLVVAAHLGRASRRTPRRCSPSPTATPPARARAGG